MKPVLGIKLQSTTPPGPKKIRCPKFQFRSQQLLTKNIWPTNEWPSGNHNSPCTSAHSQEYYLLLLFCNWSTPLHPQLPEWSFLSFVDCFRENAILSPLCVVACKQHNQFIRMHS